MYVKFEQLSGCHISAIVEKTLMKPEYTLKCLILPWRTIDTLEW